MIDAPVSQNAIADDIALKKCNVLVVDDDEISANIITHIISDIAQVHYVCDSLEVIDKCLSLKPDLVILDVNMPVKNGLELCRELKNTPELETIPVIFATASVEHETQKACWDAGGVDFIVKPILAMTLVHRVKNVLTNELRIQFLREISFRDPLTGLCNRHYLNTEVHGLLKSAVRNNELFGVIVLDLDYFKAFNDNYGHLAGDQCLRSVADVIMQSIHRPGDTVIRFGGEEFIIVLPRTDRQGCELVGKNILASIKALNIAHSASRQGVVTASAGYMVVRPTLETTLDDVIGQADLALYEAKHNGRDRLCGFSDTYQSL